MKFPAYKRSHLPAEKRVKDLLARMTLAEKAAQMMCVWQEKAAKLVDAGGHFDLKKARTAAASAKSAGPATRAGAETRAKWRS